MQHNSNITTVVHKATTQNVQSLAESRFPYKGKIKTKNTFADRSSNSIYLQRDHLLLTSVDVSLPTLCSRKCSSTSQLVLSNLVLICFVKQRDSSCDIQKRVNNFQLKKRHLKYNNLQFICTLFIYIYLFIYLFTIKYIIFSQ